MWISLLETCTTNHTGMLTALGPPPGCGTEHLLKVILRCLLKRAVRPGDYLSPSKSDAVDTSLFSLRVVLSDSFRHSICTPGSPATCSRRFQLLLHQSYWTRSRTAVCYFYCLGTHFGHGGSMHRQSHIRSTRRRHSI
jgi:hypothetical protein